MLFRLPYTSQSASHENRYNLYKSISKATRKIVQIQFQEIINKAIHSE